MNRFQFFILLVIACSICNAQQISYPMDIGNTWEYWNPEENSFTYTTVILKDTTMQNGKSYTVFSNEVYLEQRYFHRQSGDSIYCYSSGVGVENLFFNFTRNVGDTINSFFNGFSLFFLQFLDNFIRINEKSKHRFTSTSY